MLCLISRVAYASDHSQVRTGYMPSLNYVRQASTAAPLPSALLSWQLHHPPLVAQCIQLLHVLHVLFDINAAAPLEAQDPVAYTLWDIAGMITQLMHGAAPSEATAAILRELHRHSVEVLLARRQPVLQAPTAQQTYTPAQLVAISDAPPASEFPETRLISRIAQAPARYTPYSFRHTSPAGDLDKDSQFYTDTVSDLHREAPAYARVERERSLHQSAWHTLCVAPPRRKGASPAKAALACVDVGQPSVSGSG
jgi:hypothetical protein